MIRSLNVGFKTWSTNLQYIPIAKELFSKEVFDYIELFTVKDSLNNLAIWKSVDIPYILHAPHSYAGLNPSDKSCREANIQLVGQVEEFNKALSPKMIIFHPGIIGEVSESIYQFQSFGKAYPALYQKIVIENKPMLGLAGEKCLGASPEEMKYILENTGRGFCFDFGHAICYAITSGNNWKDVVEAFLKLKPSMYHICDGFYTGIDSHDHLGTGEYDLKYLIQTIEESACVSLETKREYKDSLDDFVLDVKKFRELSE